MKARFETILLILIAVFAIVFVPASAQDEEASPTLTYISFDKSAVEEGLWQGNVTGDVDGDLQTQLLDLQVVGPIWLVEFDWMISTEEATFTARMTGTLNTISGLVVMTGEVIEGDFLGAQVYEQGQQVDPATGRFQGTIIVIETDME